MNARTWRIERAVIHLEPIKVPIPAPIRAAAPSGKAASGTDWPAESIAAKDAIEFARMKGGDNSAVFSGEAPAANIRRDERKIPPPTPVKPEAIPVIAPIPAANLDEICRS